MASFITYLSEAGDEHSSDQQFQDAFMLLKRAKRLLTSAFPLTSLQIVCRLDTKMMTINESESINIQSRTVYCSVSVTTNICYQMLQNIRAAMDKLNKHVIPLKQNVLKSKKTLVQSCQPDMTEPNPGAEPENLDIRTLRTTAIH